MERLTSNTDDISYLCNYLNRHSNFDGNRVKAIHKKLAEYEDLGMTPDEIHKVIKEGVLEWIPVSERLPEIDEDVIVTFNNGFVTCITFAEDGFEIWWEDSGEVIAWKPLPEPYGEGEN